MDLTHEQQQSLRHTKCPTCSHLALVHGPRGCTVCGDEARCHRDVLEALSPVIAELMHLRTADCAICGGGVVTVRPPVSGDHCYVHGSCWGRPDVHLLELRLSDLGRTPEVNTERRPEHEHFATITYDQMGGFPRLHFTCQADGATNPPCYMVCPHDTCEEGCVNDSHVLENGGFCQVVEWLENSDAEECVIEDTSVTVPIAYQWCDGVDWKFAT